jgi:hypothetical protein
VSSGHDMSRRRDQRAGNGRHRDDHRRHSRIRPPSRRNQHSQRSGLPDHHEMRDRWLSRHRRHRHPSHQRRSRRRPRRGRHQPAQRGCVPNTDPVRSRRRKRLHWWRREVGPIRRTAANDYDHEWRRSYYSCSHHDHGATHQDFDRRGKRPASNAFGRTSSHRQRNGQGPGPLGHCHCRCSGLAQTVSKQHLDRALPGSNRAPAMQERVNRRPPGAMSGAGDRRSI